MTPFGIRQRVRAMVDAVTDVVREAQAQASAPTTPARRAAKPPAPTNEKRNWELSSQAELVDHIVSHHHAGLRRELPGLVEAARRLEREEARHAAVPRGLADTLAALSSELQAHMLSEESSLFPELRTGARGGPLGMQIRMMGRDHDEHAASLQRIREQTANLQAPAGASADWTELYAGLATLESELREHIFLEDALLFARAAGTSGM